MLGLASPNDFSVEEREWDCGSGCGEDSKTAAITKITDIQCIKLYFKILKAVYNAVVSKYLHCNTLVEATVFMDFLNLIIKPMHLLKDGYIKTTELKPGYIYVIN